MNIRKAILSLVALTASIVAFGQITVTNTQTVQNLINNVLIGSGVTATNITVNGSAPAAAMIQPSASYFNQNATSFPIADGVLLTTGVGAVAVGPNSAGGESNAIGTLTVTDPDMISIAAANVTNGIVIEFDFVATGNQLEFNYIFGSEEYPEFAPPNSSAFNDVFGFFLSGAGLAGPFTNGAVNLATIPGTTTPVSINNVNAITNNAYYQNNGGGLAYGTAIEYDGTTTLLTAFSELICGETYHIKLGVANVGDQGWDSGVFIEGGSFTTNPVAFTFNSYAENDIISEGCSQFGNLVFTRQGCGNENDSLVAYITYGGTSIMGTDYDILPDSVVLPPGTDTVIWQINPFEDGLIEGIESIELTIMSIMINGDTIYSYGTFYINDVPDFEVTASDISLFCITDSTDVFAVPDGGFPPYTYSWSNGETDSLFNFMPGVNGSTDFIVTVTDFCGYETVDTATIVMNQTLAIDTMLSYPSSICDPNGAVSAFVSGQTGIPYYNWSGPGANSPNFVDATVFQDIPPGWYYFTVSDNVCELEDSIMVDVEPGAIAAGNASPNYGCAPLTVTFSNTSQNAVSYQWDLGGGNIINTNSTNSVSETYINSAVITLIAFDALDCPDTTYISIVVDPCGCTDPLALNYNPIATIEDGSCVYPLPIVDAPNVFTPNGDGENDLFQLNHQFAVEIELVVLNRWGNVMYESTGPNPAWDGKVKGNVASDGTYFYKYLARGAGGDEITGHGFVQLITD
jgi:gliding motility-associated-like protein